MHSAWFRLPIYLFPALLSVAEAQDLRSVYQRLGGIDLRVPATASTRSFLESGNDKIDPGLRLLADQSRTRGLGGLESAARSLVIPVSDGLIEVAVSAEGDANAVARRIESAGGEVDATVDDVVLARVPPAAIERLGADRDVAYVNRQGTYYAMARPAYAGTEMVKVAKLHAKGVRGKGVKVGVLDFGFGGYQRLQAAGIIPKPVAGKAFGKAADWAVGVEHGTACVEIVHAMAPEAEIAVAMVGDGSGRAGDGDIVAAATWLMEQKVDIISFSGGGHAGPHDGRAVLDKVVELANQRGILWVNAAGNEGDNHWSGTARDTDRDGWIDLGPNREPFLMLRPKANAAILLVNWNDWGADPLTPSATEDLDVFLFAYDPATKQATQIAQSTNPQRGRGAPLEFVGANVMPDRIYLLAIRAVTISKSVRVHVYSMAPAEMFPASRQGSIGIPATGPYAIGVGAIDVSTGKLQTYSSQGPTDDDRVKPEVTAPDNDISEAYGKRFPGTSAACPHVAGLAALVRQMRRGGDVAALRKGVIAAARKLSDPVPNNETGHGIIDGDLLLAGGSGSGGDLSSGRSDAIEIPSDLGGRLSISALDRLRASAGESADSPIAPKVVVGRQEYRIGDGLKIGFKVEEDCYYLLVHRDVRGRYTLLAPATNASRRLRSGERYTEPGGENRTLKITPPAGEEEVLLICARSLLDLESWDRGNRDVAVAVARYRVTEE